MILESFCSARFTPLHSDGSDECVNVGAVMLFREVFRIGGSAHPLKVYVVCVAFALCLCVSGFYDIHSYAYRAPIVCEVVLATTPGLRAELEQTQPEFKMPCSCSLCMQPHRLKAVAIVLIFAWSAKREIVATSYLCTSTLVAEQVLLFLEPWVAPWAYIASRVCTEESKNW